MIYIYLGIITVISIFEFLLKYYNFKFISAENSEIQKSFKGELSPEEIIKSRKYTSEKSKLGLFSEIVSFVFTIFLILFGFRIIEFFSETISNNYILRGLIFFGIFGILSYLISLPFSLYASFSI